MAPDPAAPNAAGPGERYRGRFAPSPTGPLHFGSLVAAIASYLRAASNDGEWLLRIEDIDPPREEPGAANEIIAALDAHGFRWHGAAVYQSRHTERFGDVVATLLNDELAYACVCSRAEIRRIARRGPAGSIYPGTCRSRNVIPTDVAPAAMRIRTTGARIVFDDLVQGHIECDVEREIGDFVIRRKDGLIAYSLAVVIDDHDENISEIVRGADLLEFTPAQIYLQQLLGLSRPTYCHVPVVTNRDGTKLSKQTGAIAIDPALAPTNLVRGLEFLGQDPPGELAKGGVDDVWAWAREHWSVEKLAAADSHAPLDR